MVDASLSNANREVVASGSLTPGIGGALITTVQVAPGSEYSYNAWYGGDHFYAGMMYIPWCFSGSRWMATQRLRDLRYPADTAFVEPLTDGNFLNMYLGAAGHMDEFSENILTALYKLTDEERMNRDGSRRQVFTAHQDYVGAVHADPDGPRDFHAFDHPYRGCVLEVVDAPDVESRDGLATWLFETHLPARIATSPAAMCLVFSTREYPGSGYVTQEMPIDRFTRRVVLLWMLPGDPADSWDFFAEEGAAVDASGLGRMEYISGYVRLDMGSDAGLEKLYA